MRKPVLGLEIMTTFAISMSALATLSVSPASAQTAAPPSAQYLYEQVLGSASVKPGTIPRITDLNPEPETDGPAIPRLVAQSKEPVFELIRHPRARAGEKIVTIAVPKMENGSTNLNSFQVSVKISVLKTVDECNRVIFQGQLSERSLPGASHLKYYEVRIKPESMTSTLKSCTSRERKERPVAVNTELSFLRPLRDTLVLYVPEDVNVEAELWAAIKTIPAQVVP